MTSTEEEMVKEGILAVVVCAWKVSTRNPFVEGMRMLVGEVVRDFVAMARAWRGHRQANKLFELWRSESQRSTGAAKLFAAVLGSAGSAG